MIGRGAPPNVARWTGLGSPDDGYPITNADLDGSANGKRTIRKDDFVLVRNGFRNSTSREGTGAVMHIARRAAKHIAFCARSIIEANCHSVFRRRLKGLAKDHDIFETLKQDLTQRRAADRPGCVQRRLSGAWKIIRKQSAKLVVEEGDGGTYFG
jgi:hypothetical protein